MQEIFKGFLQNQRFSMINTFKNLVDEVHDWCKFNVGVYRIKKYKISIKYQFSRSKNLSSSYFVHRSLNEAPWDPMFSIDLFYGLPKCTGCTAETETPACNEVSACGFKQEITTRIGVKDSAREGK